MVAVHKGALAFAAGVSRHVTTVTATYTALLTDDVIIAQGAAPFTITLPTAASAWDATTSTGKQLTFINVDTDDCTIDGAAAETINGSATLVLSAQYQRAVLVSNGTAWFTSDLVTVGAGGIDSDQIAAGAIDLAHMSANSVDSDQYVDGSIDAIHLSANSVDSDAYVDGSIDPAHFAAQAVETAAIDDGAVTPVKLGAASVAPAADAACAILATTTEILLTVTTAGNVAISTTSAEPGQRIHIRAVAVAGGGSYTLALVSGTLTFNSTGESATIQRTVADDAWMVCSLTAAAAGGAAATVV